MKRVLVQAGHKPPLQPGHETQTGAPGEADLVADIQDSLVRMLRQDANFEPVPVPGRIEPGLRVDAALFLHADGVTNPTARGFSLGFPQFDVNRRLANLVAEEIQQLPGHPARRPDNGTADMAQYFGFRLVETPGPEVLVEHGFVTNPDEHRWLRDHVEALARAELRALRRFFGFPAGAAPAEAERQPLGEPADGAPITPASRLRTAPRAPRARVEQFMRAHAPHGDYTEDDVRRIVGAYYATAQAARLDPLLLVSQMVLETGHLRSFWSQRPRRNMAGIGVTGVPGEGVSFPTLEVAVRAHVGRVLRYVLPRGAETPAERELIREALAFRDLRPQLFGAAPTLQGFVNTWAHDGDYAKSIARIANEIRS